MSLRLGLMIAVLAFVVSFSVTFWAGVEWQDLVYILPAFVVAFAVSFTASAGLSYYLTRYLMSRSERFEEEE